MNADESATRYSVRLGLVQIPGEKIVVGACEILQGPCLLEAPTKPEIVIDELQFGMLDFKGTLAAKTTVIVFKAHGYGDDWDILLTVTDGDWTYNGP